MNSFKEEGKITEKDLEIIESYFDEITTKEKQIKIKNEILICENCGNELNLFNDYFCVNCVLNFNNEE